MSGKKRRAPGSLEGEVLAALWAADTAMSPEGVRAALGGDLAHTTVATILTRLCDKGVLDRSPSGRGYVYEPVMDQADMTARRMQELLDDETDRGGVLSRFVARLDEESIGQLRSVLDGGGRPSRLR